MTRAQDRMSRHLRFLTGFANFKVFCRIPKHINDISDLTPDPVNANMGVIGRRVKSKYSIDANLARLFQVLRQQLLAFYAHLVGAVSIFRAKLTIRGTTLALKVIEGNETLNGRVGGQHEATPPPKNSDDFIPLCRKQSQVLPKCHDRVPFQSSPLRVIYA